MVVHLLVRNHREMVVHKQKTNKNYLYMVIADKHLCSMVNAPESLLVSLKCLMVAATMLAIN